jgi:hypothetical protein
MLAKPTKTTGLFLIIALLVVPSFALAAGAEGDWTQLNAGDQHSYTLEYTGHHDFEEADEEDKAIWVSSNVDVRMDVEPDGGAIFRIITPDQMAAWSAGEDLESCGCGTQNDYVPSDLNWSGNFGEPGTYYLLVDYTGNGKDPVYYSLAISGRDVTYQSSVAGTDEAAEPTTTQATAGTRDVSGSAGGTGPVDALAPKGQWMSLAGGETLWYAFSYHGHHDFPKAKDDEEKKDPVWIASQVDARLDSEPDGSVTFSVWSEDQVRLWLTGEEFEPLGRGTANDYDPGDLSWAGSFGGPGRYYIVVENEGQGQASFLLSISGEDVTF